MKSLRTPEHSLWHNFLILTARVLIGWLYVDAGFRKLLAMDPFIAGLVRRNVPWATFWGWSSALIEFLGGLAVLLGAWTRCGALALLVVTIVATLISHRYWEFTDAAARRMQQGQFMKNLAIIGGFLLMLVTGAGRFSWDGWRRR